MTAVARDDARQLRGYLGRFATGVAIVAAETEGGTHAMTASSFLSVSLNPPLALVSVRSDARMHDYLCRVERFSVSVLTDAQEKPALQFAGQRVAHDVALGRHDGLPVVEPALATFVLRKWETVPAGDHHLHIGEIERCWGRDGEPLVHFNGAFRRLRRADEGSTASGLSWWAQDSPW